MPPCSCSAAVRRGTEQEQGGTSQTQHKGSELSPGAYFSPG
nr:MAG TPA: hypothetical protein [Caudoviricetes sp.]DAX90531.1 MAG TPA: hypothetical protein [Caudoviricetes sp.]